MAMDSARRYGGRRVATAVASCLVLTGLVLVAPMPAAASCDLVPTVAHVTVNQGTDDYSPLTWGAETIVRPYLLLPSCASAGSIKTQAATLTVKVGAVSVATIQPYYSLSTPQTITLCCTPSSDSPADPLFLVPASAMAQGAGEVPLIFTIDVGYVTSANQTGSIRTEVMKTLGKRTNPLRLLMVRMGNNALSSPFSSTDQSIMQGALGTVARMFPVAGGFDTLSAASTSSAGIRWQPTLGLLDLGTSTSNGLGVLDSAGKFCGNSSNIEAIKLALVNHVQGWHAANPASPVDRAAGVVSSQTNLGSSTTGCNDGQAAAPGNVSWTGLRVASSKNPQITGSVLAQELTHNFGGVAPSDVDRHIGWHSRSIAAETADRAYNLITREWLSADRSVMRNSDGWHDSTTLLEGSDWAWNACSMGGSATGCAAPESTGSPASTFTLFEISGTTDGTRAGTHFVSNKLEGGTESPEAEPSTDPAHPNYYLVFRRGNKAEPGDILKTHRIEVSDESTDHHSDDTSDGTATVNVRSLLPGETTLVEVWRGQPDTTIRCATAPSCLYDAEETGGPEILSLEVTPNQWTFDRRVTDSPNRDEADPSLSVDGEYLAYIERSGDCGALVVMRVSDDSKARLEGCGTSLAVEPSLSPDVASVAFVRDGDLWRVAFDKQTMSFGTETKIYSCVREAGACVTGGIRPPLSGPASSPSWSPTTTARADQWLAFSVQNDLYRLFPFRGLDVGGVGVAQPERLTSDERSDQPTVGPINPDGSQLIAFRRATPDGPALHALDVTKSGFPAEQIICCGRTPSWGGHLIAYEDVSADGSGRGRISFVNPDVPESRRVVSATGDDASPSLAPAFGGTLALQRTFGSGETRQTDIMLGRTTARRDITMVVQDPDNPSELDGYIYGRCGGADVPIAVALKGITPDPADPSVVAFVAENHETSVDCRNAASVGLVSDDFSLSEKFVGEIIPTPFKNPVTAILSPVLDAKVTGEGPIAMAGSAWDAEGMVLPDSALQWAIRLPGAQGWTNVPTPGGKVDVRPADLGFSTPRLPAGAYRARLTATDPEGRQGESIVDFVVTGPRAVVDFDPNSLQMTSSGNPVTLGVSGVQGLAQAKSARIVAIDGIRLEIPIDATSWRFDSSKATGQAQFDRQKLIAVIPPEKIGQRILVTIEGCSKGPWACGSFGDVFSGADPAAPITSK